MQHSQLVPCEGPRAGGKWKNHGHHMRAIIRAARDFRKANLNTHGQEAQIVTSAALSKCGWNRRWDHDGDWGRGREGDSDRDRGGDREAEVALHFASHFPSGVLAVNSTRSRPAPHCVQVISNFGFLVLMPGLP